LKKNLKLKFGYWHGHDVSRYYSRAIKITDVNELGDVMISQLNSLFDTKKKLH